MARLGNPAVSRCQIQMPVTVITSASATAASAARPGDQWRRKDGPFPDLPELLILRRGATEKLHWTRRRRQARPGSASGSEGAGRHGSRRPVLQAAGRADCRPAHQEPVPPPPNPPPLKPPAPEPLEVGGGPLPKVEPMVFIAPPRSCTNPPGEKT